MIQRAAPRFSAVARTVDGHPDWPDANWAVGDLGLSGPPGSLESEVTLRPA
jgi:hypothetical protein